MSAGEVTALPDSVSLAADDLPPYTVFQLLTGLVIPRPISWTSTISEDGVVNLAPFSFFTVVSTRPPMLALSIEPSADGSPKDTVRNIERTREFVVNTVSTDLGPAMAHSSETFDPEVDELALSGLTALPSTRVRPPRVGESKASMECKLHAVLRPGSDWLVIGQVVAFHVDRTVRDGHGHVDIAAMRSVGRVAAEFIDVEQTYSLSPRTPSHP